MRKSAWVCVALLLTGMMARPVCAQSVAMVADNGSKKVIVFNPETDTVLGSVPLPIVGISTVGDCSITPDRTLGFVTDLRSRVWVIDLAATPPQLAAGTNPIPISNFGEDTAVTADGKFLLVCDGAASQPLSVVDIAARAQIGTFSLGADCCSVDVAADGSVLVTSDNANVVRRLRIDAAGVLHDTGESMAVDDPANVYLAPNGASGFVVRYSLHAIQSFREPGLTAGDVRVLSGLRGASGCFNPAGTRVFARSTGGFVQAFDFNPATGQLGAAPLYTIPISNTTAYYGIEQLAVGAEGTKLYVPQPNAVRVYDANSGALLRTITHPDLRTPLGISVSPKALLRADAGPDQFVAPGEPVILKGSDGSGATAYRWEQLRGPAVELTGADTPTATFVAPAGPPGTRLTFQYTISAGTLASSDTVNVYVRDPGTFAVSYFDNFNYATNVWDDWHAAASPRYCWNDEYRVNPASGRSQTTAHYRATLDVLDLLGGFPSLDGDAPGDRDWNPLQSVDDPTIPMSPHHQFACVITGIAYFEAGDVLGLTSDDDAYLFVDDATAWGQELLAIPHLSSFEHVETVVPAALAGLHRVTVKFADRVPGEAGIQVTCNGFPLDAVNLPPAAEAGGPYSVNEGSDTSLTATASDPDGDALSYAWDLDGDGTFETAGQTVSFHGVDGPGQVTVAVKVTDAGGLASTDTAVVDVVNVAPTVGAIGGSAGAVRVKTAVNLSAAFTDPGVLDTHTAFWNWGDGSASPGDVAELNGSGTASGSHAYAQAGFYRVTLEVLDKDGGAAYSAALSVVVFDPEGGFVTGGGWFNSPAGAWKANPRLTGKANFGFVAKYEKRTMAPQGQTVFILHSAGLKFQSARYEWLVVSGAQAMLKGTGALNGRMGYAFALTAVDGRAAGGKRGDRLRMQLWEVATGQVVYDNQVGGGDVGTALGGGSIVIHKPAPPRLQPVAKISASKPAAAKR